MQKAAKVQEAPQVPERPASATALPPTAPAPAEELPDEEIKRRLRRLGEPATMFGEDSEVRRARLRHAEATMEVQDNAGAGERANELLAIRKEDREREKRSQSANASTSAAAAGPQAKGDGADAQVCLMYPSWQLFALHVQSHGALDKFRYLPSWL